MIKESTKELSREKREELFIILRDRFEKNMNRHEGLKWADIQIRLEANPQRLASISDGRNRRKNLTLSILILKQANISSLTAQRRLPKAEEAFVTIVRRWSQGKSINLKTAPLIWRMQGYRSFSEEQYRKLQKLGRSMKKTQAGENTR